MMNKEIGVVCDGVNAIVFALSVNGAGYSCNLTEIVFCHYDYRSEDGLYHSGGFRSGFSVDPAHSVQNPVRRRGSDDSSKRFVCEDKLLGLHGPAGSV
jgi:hypothetical protein